MITHQIKKKNNSKIYIREASQSSEPVLAFRPAPDTPDLQSAISGICGFRRPSFSKGSKGSETQVG